MGFLESFKECQQNASSENLQAKLGRLECWRHYQKERGRENFEKL
jgi:hypothetical protein